MAKSVYKVCIDAGHGELDPGAIGPKGLMEKDVTLAVTLNLGKNLKRSDIEVIYTRVDDNPGFPSDERQNLANRVSIANTSNADCFVSIHCNSSTTKQHGNRNILCRVWI